MTEISKFRVGMFLVVTVALLAIMLMAFGLRDRFVPKASVVSFFDESVQGLDIGSSVKFRGVPIGRVSAIFIETRSNRIRVEMEVDFRAFTVSGVGETSLSLKNFYDFFANERDKGLRSRLNLTGITGMKYIELDYAPSAVGAYTVRPEDDVPGFFVMPSQSSTINNLMEKFNHSLDQLASIDFKGISEKLTVALTDVSRLMSDDALFESIAQLSKVTANLERITNTISTSISEESVETLMQDVSTTLQEMTAMSRNLAEQVAAAQFDDTARSVRQGATSFGDLSNELSVTSNKLNQTLDSLTALLEYLTEDPNSLIFGKRRPELEIKR